MHELAQKLAQQIRNDPAYQGARPIIAIARFKLIPDDLHGSIADFVLADLQTAMVQTGVCKVVLREQVDKVLKEQQIDLINNPDSTKIRRAGILLGADGIIIGTISDRGELCCHQRFHRHYEKQSLECGGLCRSLRK